MSSILKGTFTVIVATVVASATILMTGNTVADGNRADGIQQEKPALETSIKDEVDSTGATNSPEATKTIKTDQVLDVGNTKTDAVVVAKASSLNQLAPPPGPFNIENKNTKRNGLNGSMNIAPPQMPSPPSEPVAIVNPKSPDEPVAPQTPDISEKNAVVQASSLKNELSEKVAPPKVPVVPKTPEMPAEKLIKPAQTVSAPVMPVEVEKSLGSFKPLAPSLNVGQGLPAEKLIALPPSKPEKKALLSRSLVAPELSTPQQVANPEILKSMINKQRPVQKNMPMPRGAPSSRSVMQARGSQNDMMNQRIQRSNQALWNRQQQTWHERNQVPRMYNNFPGNRFSGNPGYSRSTPQMPQVPRGMMPPSNIYRNAPPYPAGNPSNYRYPQMPQRGGSSFQMRPDNFPAMPGVRPDTNNQGQFKNPAMIQHNTKAPTFDR